MLDAAAWAKHPPSHLCVAPAQLGLVLVLGCCYRRFDSGFRPPLSQLVTDSSGITIAMFGEGMAAGEGRLQVTDRCSEPRHGVLEMQSALPLQSKEAGFFFSDAGRQRPRRMHIPDRHVTLVP